MLKIEIVFNHIKANAIKHIDRVASGMAGLFYSIIERDLVRIYREFA